MANEFLLPDIGEGLAEAEIVSWLVAPGDQVADGQPLCEVETAKAVVELPSPFAGVLLYQGAAVGDVIGVGEVVAVIGQVGESWQAPKSDAVEAPPRTQPEVTGQSNSTVQAMPVVRRLAREHGVELAAVEGTGPSGRITRPDVLAAAHKGRTPPDQQTLRLSATRRAIADHLTRSWHEIPHVTTFVDVDATVLLEARVALSGVPGSPIALEVLLVRAVVRTLQVHPEFNATLSGEELTMHHRYDIGLAVDTPDGLLVPVVEGSASMRVEDLASRIDVLAQAARDRSLQPAQLQGATFTVSNIGALGGGHGSPIIPLGTTAIVSFGRASDTPVVRDGNVQIAPVMPISLSYDHRVIDGALGRRFITTLTGHLNDRATYPDA